MDTIRQDQEITWFPERWTPSLQTLYFFAEGFRLTLVLLFLLDGLPGWCSRKNEVIMFSQGMAGTTLETDFGIDMRLEPPQVETQRIQRKGCFLAAHWRREGLVHTLFGNLLHEPRFQDSNFTLTAGHSHLQVTSSFSSTCHFRSAAWLDPRSQGTCIVKSVSRANTLWCQLSTNRYGLQR